MIEINSLFLFFRASSLFAITEISGGVKQEILASMADLRKKAVDEKFGPELRFAVRSSGNGTIFFFMIE